MIDLGTIGGVASVARAINNRGQVVGESSVDEGGHPFLWQHGVMIDLGSLNGGFSGSQGTGTINDRGQVVGFSEDLDGNVTAFLWQDGKLIDLGETLGGVASSATGINNRGQIVGVVDTETEGHAFLLHRGIVTNLGTLGGTISIAKAINNRGQVVGLSTIPGDGEFHAFLWTK
jgi:probable HAF family extracellular repeat protein